MIKNSKILVLLLFIFLGSIYFLNATYSDENKCKYTKEIEECINSNSKRSIEEFVCIDGKKEEIIYQIILDKQFSEIDEEINDYLVDLENYKNKYFGPDANFTYLEAIDEIESNFSLGGKYYYKYKNICGTNLIQEVQACQGGETSIDESKDFFKKSLCMSLAETKLDIYKEVAYDVLLLNKSAVKKDAFKKYVQEDRKKYDEILNKMMINMGYLERISKKWPSKTSKCFPN